MELHATLADFYFYEICQNFIFATILPQLFVYTLFTPSKLDHYFSEQDRVHKGIEAWQERGINRFGELVFESGKSSVCQYEFGSLEIIHIIEILQECPGVVRARFN